MFFRRKTAPDELLGGSYSLIATSSSVTTPADADTSNDTAVLATQAPA